MLVSWLRVAVSVRSVVRTDDTRVQDAVEWIDVLKAMQALETEFTQEKLDAILSDIGLVHAKKLVSHA
jgi:hypothetical protein